MAKPTLYRIVPFDASVGTTIKFSWTGRNQQANVATIYDASDNIVYQKVYHSYKGEHKIPVNSGLQNGQSYRVTIIVIDMDEKQFKGIVDYTDYNEFKDLLDHPSEESNPEVFRCYTTPVLEFENYPQAVEPYKIENSSISLTLVYTQVEEEPLNTWIMYLCDSSYTILQQSSETYAANTMYSFFSGLDDKTTYFIRATGETVHGMPVDTGYIQIKTSYGVPGRFINLNVTNNFNDGTIHIESFAVSQTGHAASEPVEFVNDEKGNPYAANLANNYVTFNEELSINKDFTLFFRGKDVRVINKKDYESTIRLPESGINEGVNTLGEILLYNSFLMLTDTTTGKRYSFTLWNTDGIYQVFMYCNDPDDPFSLWSDPITLSGFTFDSSQLDIDKIGGNNLLLGVQRKSGQFSIKAFSY